MKIVIDISEEKYNEIRSLKFVLYGLQSEENKKFFYLLINAIQDGTPLPKNHGRLIDADALLLNPDNLKDMLFRRETIYFAPTIVEAEEETE